MIAMRRKRLKKPHDEGNNERWLLTYADMITLLLGLFIVLYSISTVDSKKLKTVAGIIRSGFNVQHGGTSLFLDGTETLEDSMFTPKSYIYRLWEKIGHALKKFKNQDKLKLGLAQTEEIRLVLFSSSLGEGEFKPDDDTNEILEKISALASEMDVDIHIRMHIPYQPGEQGKFSNNWEYHAHRASMLAEYVTARFGIDSSRLIVEGLSEFREIKKGDGTPESKAGQERIEIIIRKKE